MKSNQRIYEKYVKRPQDLLISIIALIVLSPVILVVAILVRCKLGSPIIFRQERPGLNESIFRMYKFRTMTDEKNDNGELMPDSIRLTRFGKILRATSLDELPGLLNIVNGNMAIVGPRPLLVQYLSLYNAEQQRRHNVRPGLTGHAQVNGRNSISWDEKFKLDIEYVDQVNFIGDWKIIILTIRKVLIREGISSDTSATMEYFEGSKVGGNYEKN